MTILPRSLQLAPLASIAAALALLASSAASRADDAPVPPQLNIGGFAYCLSQREAGFDLGRLHEAYGFSDYDLLLLYLSLYSGKRIPGLGFAQDAARLRWETARESQAAALASWLQARADEGLSRPLLPAEAFGEALALCGGGGDVFCASLLAHNVLRTLGRHDEAIFHDPETGEATDYNPAWFIDGESGWLAAIPGIQRALIPLRADGGGDRWGEWYHFFGILAFAVHEASLARDLSDVDFVARLNRLLNPLLAGGPEEPEKARLDRDAVGVSRAYLWQEGLDPSASCGERAGYVALVR